MSYGAVHAVPPLRRVLDLLRVDEERRALLDQRLERLGDEELEIRLAAAVVVDRQHVLAELPERDLVHVRVRRAADHRRRERRDRRLRRELGGHRVDLRLRVQREPRASDRSAPSCRARRGRRRGRCRRAAGAARRSSAPTACGSRTRPCCRAARPARDRARCSACRQVPRVSSAARFARMHVHLRAAAAAGADVLELRAGLAR